MAGDHGFRTGYSFEAQGPWDARANARDIFYAVAARVESEASVAAIPVTPDGGDHAHPPIRHRAH